jgi:hypothetical protein
MGDEDIFCPSPLTVVPDVESSALGHLTSAGYYLGNPTDDTPALASSSGPREAQRKKKNPELRELGQKGTLFA